MTPSLSTASAAPRRFQIDSRFIAPILISIILLISELVYRNLEDYRKTVLAIVTSIALEAALGLIVTRRVPHLASAYVSGISCGILVRSPEWWPYAFAAALSIASKYAIRVNGRHLWNPSNLAIVTLLLVAPDTVATLNHQWGNHLWPMLVIWTLGSIIIYRLKRFHICATYVLSFFAFALLRAAAGEHGGMPFWNAFLSESAPITGPMYQLFIFFMITDPKTTIQPKWGQITVAFLIAMTESALRMWAPSHIAIHAPYFALTMMGPSANLIEIFLQRRARREVPAGA